MALRNKAPAHLIDNILLKTLRPMRPSASQNAELVLGWAHSGLVKLASYNIDRVVIPYIFGIVVTSSLIIILLIMARSLSQNLKTFVRPLPLSLSFSQPQLFIQVSVGDASIIWHRAVRLPGEGRPEDSQQSHRYSRSEVQRSLPDR